MGHNLAHKRHWHAGPVRVNLQQKKAWLVLSKKEHEIGLGWDDIAAVGEYDFKTRSCCFPFPTLYFSRAAEVALPLRQRDPSDKSSIYRDSGGSNDHDIM